MTRRKVRTASAACIALLIGVVAGAQAQEYQQPPTAKPAGCPQTGLLIAGAAGANTLDGTPLSDVIRGGAGNTRSAAAPAATASARARATTGSPRATTCATRSTAVAAGATR